MPRKSLKALNSLTAAYPPAPFWAPEYLNGYTGDNWNATQGGTTGYDANHSTIVPYALWWMQQELLGNRVVTQDGMAAQ